jgi:hypothetical protein
MQINKRPKITNLQHPKVKVKTFNIQKQKPLTSKSKSKNLQHPRIRAITFNIQK